MGNEVVKAWPGCRNCQHKAVSSPKGGNIICGLRDTAGDGFNALTRRKEAARRGDCFHFAPLDPVADLNRLPGNVPAMRKNATKENAPAVEVVPLDIDPMERPLWEIDPDFLNPFEELPPIQTWAKMGDRPAFPKEGIILVKAKPKQGKSYSTYASLIPLFTQKQFNTLTPLDRPRLVLVFDMEMSKTTLTNRIYKHIQTLGDNGQRFIVASMKHLPLPERMPFIQKKVAMYNPDIIIIDQAGQLVANVNDDGEASSVVRQIDQLSIGRSVFVVHHENKSKEDSNARGAIGTQLQFAQVETYTSSKDKGIFTLKPEEARDTDTDGAAPFVYIIDKDGFIRDGREIAEAKEEEDRAAWINNMTRIFGDDETLSRSEIIKRVMEIEGLKESAADAKVTIATKTRAIVKTGDGHRDPYRVNVNCP